MKNAYSPTMLLTPFPETVTILSSDDEEPHVATATSASVATAVVHPLTPSVAVASTSDVTSQAESPLVPTAATMTTTSQLYVSRRQRMEDEVCYLRSCVDRTQ